MCAHACFHLFTYCTRDLLSACSVPGTVARFLWVCLSMPLLLLWGPLRASLSPNCYLFVSLGVSGCVCPVCVSVLVSLQGCAFLPFLGSASALLDTAGQPQGPPAALTSPCLPFIPSLPLLCWLVPTEPFLVPSNMGMCSASKGVLVPQSLVPA